MKIKLKKRLIACTSLVVAVVLIVEFNKFMARQNHSDCQDGACRRPSNYGLIIDPFPAELEQATPQPVADPKSPTAAVPVAETNLPSKTP